ACASGACPSRCSCSPWGSSARTGCTPSGHRSGRRRDSCCSGVACCGWPRCSPPRESTATASPGGCSHERAPRVAGPAGDQLGAVREPGGEAGARRRTRRRSGQPRSRHTGARGRADVLSDALPHREGEMLWPNRRLRRPRNVELQERVSAVRRETPESDPWLNLLEAALAESETGAAWETAVPKPAVERPAKAPLLFHTRIPLDARAARGWVRRLLTLAVPAQARRIDAI